MTASLLRLTRSILPLALLFSAGLACVHPLMAQPPPAQIAAKPPLRFEVASIRPRAAMETEPSNRKMLPGGRFRATATTVLTLLRISFAGDNIRVPKSASWVNSVTFDIDATTVGHTEITKPEQFQQVILGLLQDRFGLTFHREPKEAPIYWLVLNKPGKLGPDLKPTGPNEQPNMSTNSNGARAQMRVIGMSMTDIAAGLSRQAGRPVEDHTGVTGKYDFQIQWSPALSTDSIDPSLFTVLKERLGLRLQPAKGSIESIVIDTITRPTEN